MLYIFGFGTARLGEWRLNHIHSINGAEDINASCSDSSAEMDYSSIMTINELIFLISIYIFLLDCVDTYILYIVLNVSTRSYFSISAAMVSICLVPALSPYKV